MTTLRAIGSSETGPRLDIKAVAALIEAVKFQLDAWSRLSSDAMDEDEFADLQNDRMYLETVLDRLEEHYRQRTGPITL